MCISNISVKHVIDIMRKNVSKESQSNIYSGFAEIYHSISDFPKYLTHCGRATHICVSKLTIIGSDNGLSPGRRQAII